MVSIRNRETRFADGLTRPALIRAGESEMLAAAPPERLQAASRPVIGSRDTAWGLGAALVTQRSPTDAMSLASGPSVSTASVYGAAVACGDRVEKRIPNVSV